MNLTNKKIILIYALSPYLVGVAFGLPVIYESSKNLLSPLMFHINIPFGYLIDYLQIISMISGACYAYGIVAFLLLVVIPFQLMAKLAVKDKLTSRAIKIITVFISLMMFFSLGFIRLKASFLFKLGILILYIFVYVLLFHFIPKKIITVSEKQSGVDKFSHMWLPEVICVALCIFWIESFADNISQSVFLVFDSSYLFGGVAVIFFCIPAMIVGIIRVRISHMKPIVQVIICSLTGLLLSFGFGLFFGEYWSIALCIAGGITALLVTIIVNLLDTLKKTDADKADLIEASK